MFGSAIKANDGEISVVVFVTDKKNKEKVCEQVRDIPSYEARR